MLHTWELIVIAIVFVIAYPWMVRRDVARTCPFCGTRRRRGYSTCYRCGRTA